MTTKLQIDLFGKQEEFVSSETPYTAFVAGIGSGKTRAGVIKSLKYASQHRGSLGMITAPTFPMLRDATLRTVMEIFPKGFYEFWRTDMRLQLKNGSEILFRSTDDPEHLRGPNLAFIYMDEAAQSSKEAFNILQGRLRQAGFPPQLWITTTPQGFNWVYTEFASQQRDDYTLITCATRENPYLTKAFVARLEEAYADDFKLQELEGQFVIVGGRTFFHIDSLKDMIPGCQEPVEMRSGGAVRVWKKPYIGGRYVAGGDLSWGETGAYSVLTIADWQTGEQVAEIYGRLHDDEMALETIWLCQEYNNAYVGVENNSEGINTVYKMVELGYGNRMYWEDTDHVPRMKPGWHTGPGTRPIMMRELEEAIRNRRILPRCRDAISEMMSFVRDEKGRPAHSLGAYDDHVFSWAVLWQMRKYAGFSLANYHGVSRKRVQ